MMEELNPYTKISPALASDQQSAGAVLGIVLLLLLIMLMLGLVVWFRYRQRQKGRHIPTVTYTPALHINSTDYSLSGEVKFNFRAGSHLMFNQYLEFTLLNTCWIRDSNWQL